MNPKTVLILFSFIVLALALVPFASAQEGNMLTDGLSGIWDTLSGYGAQAATYVSEHQAETAAIGGVGGVAAVAGAGWKAASSAKGKLQSAYDGLTQKLSGVENQASNALTELSSYKSQAETQFSTLQTETQKQIEAAKTQAANATSQLGGLQDKVTDLTQQKASLQNEKERLEQLVHDWQIKYEAVCPKVK